MNITADALARIFGVDANKLGMWPQAISEAMATYEVNTPARAALVLACIAHDSECLHSMYEEWHKTPDQLARERNLAHAWPPTDEDGTNATAFHFGNSEIGDAFRFRGTGLVRCAGRTAFAEATDGLREKYPHAPDFCEHPAMLGMSEWGARYAVWHLVERCVANAQADAGGESDLLLGRDADKISAIYEAAIAELSA